MQERATQEMERLVFGTLELARSAGRVERFFEAFYESMLDRPFPVPPGVGWVEERSPAPTSREVLPARCIAEGASVGRDADTISSVLGG